MLGTEGARLILHSHGVQREGPLGCQLGHVPALGVEVIVGLVGWSVGQVDGEGQERREREREERETVRDWQVNPGDGIKVGHSPDDTHTRNSTWNRQKEGQGRVLLMDKSRTEGVGHPDSPSGPPQ